MPKNALLIRSDGSLDRLKYSLGSLCEQKSADIHVIIDSTENKNFTADEIINNFKHVKSVTYLTKGFINFMGLQYFKKCAWQCGDYFYYKGYAALQSYQYYWLIDDDVVFNVDFDKFIIETDKFNNDILAFELGQRKSNWSWFGSMNHKYPDQVFGMLYPLSRLSGRAIEHLAKERRSYNSLISSKVYESSNSMILGHANDEAFTATTLLNAGFSGHSLYQIYKNEFSGFFSTERPILYEELDKPHTQNKILHPVGDAQRARQKFGIIYKKYGANKMLRRAQEIVKFCGTDQWQECFDVPLNILEKESSSSD